MSLIDLKIGDIRDTIYDVTFAPVREWKKQNPGKKVVGTFPVYVPHELIHALGHLPVNVFGGGEEVNIAHADAILGSFICSISKSTTEMMIYGDLDDVFDGFVFPFICDVARNLSGIFIRRKEKQNTHMLHMAQNVESPSALTFMNVELNRMIKTLFPEEEIDPVKLKESIKLFNINRRLQREIYEYRSKEPWNVPLSELYQTMRVGGIMPVEIHNKFLEDQLEKFKTYNKPVRDGIRVVITGNFCEQPPADVIQLIEQVGCYVIYDEFIIGRRFNDRDLNPDAEDLIEEISREYIHHSAKIATRFHLGEKGKIMLNRVKEADAAGVIFLTAKFCEPSLDDLVLQQQALSEENIPFVHIEFEERGSGFEMVRLSLETFVESLLFD